MDEMRHKRIIRTVCVMVMVCLLTGCGANEPEVTYEPAENPAIDTGIQVGQDYIVTHEPNNVSDLATNEPTSVKD